MKIRIKITDVLEIEFERPEPATSFPHSNESHSFYKSCIASTVDEAIRLIEQDRKASTNA